MAQKRYVLMLLFIILLVPKCIYADCTKEEIKHFKSIKNDFTVEMLFDSEEKKFYPFFHNPEPENFGYILEEKTDDGIATYDFTSMETNGFAYDEISPGKYRAYVIGKTETCDSKLKSITVKVPRYNIYSEDEACQGIEEFVLCKESYDREIDYETFLSRVENYKKNKSEQEANAKEPEKTGFALLLENVKNYILENLFIIITIIVFAILLIVTIILTAKQMRKSRRLE